MEEWTVLLACVGVTAVTSIVLKFNWYDRMENHPKDLQV